MRGSGFGVRALGPALLLLVLPFSLAGDPLVKPDPFVAAARHPTLVFALDGLEWSVLGPLVASGRMPTLRRLIERGTCGYLSSLVPTESPIIWTSVATGKTPEKHGIHGFVLPARNPTPEAPVRYYTSGDRETKAIWNIFGDYGLTVHTVGWWVTYPAEAVNGIMVTQTNTLKSLTAPAGDAMLKGSLIRGMPGQVYPPELQEPALAVLDEIDHNLQAMTERVFGRFPHPLGELEQLLWRETRWAFRADATYVAVAASLLAQRRPSDLTLLYLGASDVAGHRFWRYSHPADFRYPPPADQIENLGGVLDAYYMYLDRVIGEFLAREPDDVTVFVVSDHGMHTHRQNREFEFPPQALPRDLVSGGHADAPPGVFIAAGRGIRRSGILPPVHPAPTTLATVGSVLDLTPTLLALAGIPVGRDMDGHVLAMLFTHPAAVTVRSIATHDSPAWLAARAANQVDAPDQSERLEQLRGLGYIE